MALGPELYSTSIIRLSTRLHRQNTSGAAFLICTTHIAGFQMVRSAILSPVQPAKRSHFLGKNGGGLDLPTIIFSPPFAGPPSQVFHALISDLVSHGYSVVTMDHPYKQPYLPLPDGTSISGLPFDYDSSTEEGLELIQRVHQYRLTDVSAVLEAMPTLSKCLSIPLNLTHFSFFGHSLSGSAALSQILYEHSRTTRHRHRILGALNMDGSLWGPVAASDSSADLRIPSLILSSAHHRDDPQFAGFDAQQSAWAKEINIGGQSNHTDFSDLIVVKQGLGISGDEGAVSAERMINITRTLVGDFQSLLGERGEGILSGTNETRAAWPELAKGQGPLDQNQKQSTILQCHVPELKTK